ncbi:hypothetical protein BpHYR1_005306, partial [Brachionus plicatilis]
MGFTFSTLTCWKEFKKKNFKLLGFLFYRLIFQFRGFPLGGLKTECMAEELLSSLVHVLTDRFGGSFLVQVVVAYFVRIMDADYPSELCPKESVQLIALCL